MSLFNDNNNTLCMASNTMLLAVNLPVTTLHLNNNIQCVCKLYVPCGSIQYAGVATVCVLLPNAYQEMTNTIACTHTIDQIPVVCAMLPHCRHLHPTDIWFVIRGWFAARQMLYPATPYRHLVCHQWVICCTSCTPRLHRHTLQTSGLSSVGALLSSAHHNALQDFTGTPYRHLICHQWCDLLSSAHHNAPKDTAALFHRHTLQTSGLPSVGALLPMLLSS
jgi:hypothetical protein